MVVVAIWYHVHWRLGYWPLKQSIETPCLLKEVEGKDVCVCVCERWYVSLTEKGLDLLHKIPMQSLSYAYCRWYVSRKKEYAGSLFLLIFLGENFLTEKGVCWFFHSSWFSYATLVLYTALEPCQSSLRMDEGLRFFDVIAQSFLIRPLVRFPIVYDVHLHQMSNIALVGLFPNRPTSFSSLVN